jgi:hypothetical protein
MRGIGFRLVHKKQALGSGFLALSLAWLCGCATSVSSTWHDPASGRPSFSRILIVGVSTDFNQRCAFEYSMASQFQGSATIPIASCDSMTPQQPLTRANIDTVVAANHADAVLTSAIVTLQEGSQKGNTSDTEAMTYYQVTGVGYVTGYLGAYGIPVAFVQLDTTKAIPQITGDVHMVTRLFDVKDAMQVYTVNTKAESSDVQSSSTAIDTITALIGGELRRDGIIH